MNLRATFLLGVAVLVALTLLVLESRDATNGNETARAALPELDSEAPLEAIEGEREASSSLVVVARGPDASSEQNLGEPWFVDRSDVSMTGLTMREYLRFWHEEYWHLLGPMLEEEEFYDYVFDTEHDIGEPIPCLHSMPGLLLEKFRTGVSGRAALERHLSSLPGARTISKSAPLLALRQITGHANYNPAGRVFDQGSVDWAAAVEVVRDEQAALARFIQPFLDEVEIAIAEDLRGLSAYQQPRYGALMYGPYHTREHPLYEKMKPHQPFCLSIWAGDNLGKCRAFTGTYTLVFERSPRLRPLIDEVRAYRADLEGRLQLVVAGLPVAE